MLTAEAAGKGLRWSILANLPRTHEGQPLEYRSIQVPPAAINDRTFFSAELLVGDVPFKSGSILAGKGCKSGVREEK
jgi:hypothetical protein